MRVLDLFSGIGGIALGLERVGFDIVAFCECERYCQRVLARHWPDVPIYGDIRTLSAARLADDGIERIDLIAGGFPCQDVSVAGAGAGLAGARSGLWSEMARLIGELRPRYVLVENVAALLSRGLGEVLGSLATLGYDAAWHCIPAASVGAPHRRDRIWVIAYPDGEGCEQLRLTEHGSLESPSGPLPDGSGALRRWNGAALADADRARLEGRHAPLVSERAGERTLGSRRAWERESAGWETEPDVGRVAYGIPARVDRLRALGNAAVPQVVSLLGRAILEHARADAVAKEL